MNINIKMDPDLKARWVAALRSGDFHQGEAYMYTPATPDSDMAVDHVDRHCCLGVLRYVVQGDNELPEKSDRFDDPAALPTTAERLDWGLESENGDGYPVIDLLTSFNDGTKFPGEWDGTQLTFSQIADWIEVNL